MKHPFPRLAASLVLGLLAPIARSADMRED